MGKSMKITFLSAAALLALSMTTASAEDMAFEITGVGEGDRLMSGQQSYILFK